EAPMLAAHPVVDLASSAVGLSPSVSLGLTWANSASQEAHPGRLTVGLRAVVLSGCGYRVAIDGDVDAGLRLCAIVEGGMLELRPFGFAQPTSPDRAWFSAGPLVRLDWPILPHRLTLRGDAGLAFPLEREHVHAVSEPSATTPAVAGPTIEVVQYVGARFAVAVLLKVF
ncbi:MAG: hypothetical protein K0S65_3212, partial [Labilithrix sp.]|nr:hypothetical protein [Labilithrix sp.]